MEAKLHGQLGPDAQSLAVHLNKEAGLSHGKIARFFQAAFGITLSRGGSAQIMLRAAQRCTPAYLNILVLVRNSSWVVADETGWKVGGLLQWLHVFVTEWATLYIIQPRKAVLLGPLVQVRPPTPPPYSQPASTVMEKAALDKPLLGLLNHRYSTLSSV